MAIHPREVVHRLDRGRQIIMRSLAGTDKKMTMELGGRRRTSSRRCADRPGRRRDRQRHFFNRGPFAAGSRLLVHEPVADKVLAKLKNASGAPRGRSADKNTDIGVNRASSLERIRELVNSGVRKAPRCSSPPPPAVQGFYFRPTLFSEVTMSHRIAREGNLRPGAEHPHFPHRRRGHRKSEQHRLQPSAGV
jgi:aldehyde dehydrogenase (NAD+)